MVVLTEEKKADRISSWFVPAVLALSLLTFAVWMALTAPENPVVQVPDNTTPFLFAFQMGIAVLVIACPCGMGLAVPTAVMVGSGNAAKHGILIKRADVRKQTTQSFLFVENWFCFSSGAGKGSSGAGGGV